MKPRRVGPRLTTVRPHSAQPVTRTMHHQSMRQLRGIDEASSGLGFDFAPILQAVQTGVDVYGKVEAIKHPATPAQPTASAASSPKGGGGGASSAPAGSKTLTYIVVGFAGLGAIFLAWRAFGPRGTASRR